MRFFNAIAFLAVCSLRGSSGGLPENYQSLSGRIKQALLWDQIAGTAYPKNHLRNTTPNMEDAFMQFTNTYLSQAFTHVSDEMPPGRTKLIHSLGSVAKVTWKIFPNSTYTGIFRGGTELPAFVRASVGVKDPTNFIPGIAVKVFLDGRPSANIFALNTLDGQGNDTNLFAKDFTTVLPDVLSPAAKMVSKVFAKVIPKLFDDPAERPTSEADSPVYQHAAIGETGKVRGPFMLRFVPNKSVGWNPTSKEDFRTELSKIKPGLRLWTIEASPKPESASEVIGELLLEAPGFVASAYGDDMIFFQHPTRRWKE